MQASDAQKRAIKKYCDNLDSISFRLEKGKKEIIQQHAKKQNESMSSFLNRAIDETMVHDNMKSK